MFSRFRLLLGAGIAFILCLSAVQAEDAISVTLTNKTSGETRTLSFSSVIDAVESFQDDGPQAYFEAIYNESDDLSGSVNLLGFPISADLTGNTLTYTFTDAAGNKRTRTFVGSDRDDAAEQFKDFFESDEGQDDFKALMESLQKNTGGYVYTGSETSVGLSTRQAIGQALGETPTTAETEADADVGATASAGSSEFTIGGEIGFFSQGDADGQSYTLPLAYGRKFGDRYRLRLGIPINYTDLDGAAIYRLGTELSLAITLMGAEPGADFEWTVTPGVGNYVVASVDLAAAADIVNYGVSNRLSKRFGRFTLSHGIYVGQYDSLDIEIEGYSIDPQVSETILSNGLKVGYSLARSWATDVYAIDTRALEGYMDEYQTYAWGMSYRPGVGRARSRTFRAGLAYDIGDDYDGLRFEFSGKFTF